MTPEDKAYYGDGYYPLFKLMSEEFGLTLLEQDMSEIMNCVRKMDEARVENPTTLVRMQTAPMMFWDTISSADWNRMSDTMQDELIKIAKGKL